MWSNDPDDGLEKPLRLSLDTNLTAIKKSNSTNFHYGVMSHWQMRVRKRKANVLPYEQNF